MYKAEASLFLSASNNINYAKTLINECKRLITQAELPDNSNYSNCKDAINTLDIDGLVTLVEETKEGLFALDRDFAEEYMALVQEYLTTSGLDISMMSEEEQAQYNMQMNAYARDYNTNLLYMLEQYEASGMLTPELQAQLDMQRLIIEQYKIQDQMAGLVTTSEEYIKLFEENAEYDKKIIELNPNLTEEDKIAAINEYEINFKASMDILNLNHNISVKTEELKKLEYGSTSYYKKENEIRELQITIMKIKVLS